MPRIIFLKKDVTGLLPDNFIQDEFHLTESGNSRLVIPDYGAFFEKDFEVRDADTNAIIPSTDYYFSDIYHEASLQSGKSVWNVLIITNPKVNLKIKISYRAFGGPFSRNAKLLVQWLKERETDFVSPGKWEDVEDIPRFFAPAFHNHLLRDIYGGEYFAEHFTRIENSILIGKKAVIQSIIDEVTRRLEKTRNDAINLSKAIVSKTTSSSFKKIDKKFLNLDLVANLDLATEDEVKKSVKLSTPVSFFKEDRYLNKKRLEIFSKLVKETLVSSKETNLGKERGVFGDATKASVIATVNGATIILDSIDNNKANGVDYDLMVYPKGYPTTDTFTIVRVSNNVNDKGGIWLGFNSEKIETYIGIMTSDECFRRMKWYKFYTDGNLDDLSTKVKEHIKDTKNPHELTKEQIELGELENYPVVTEAQILAQESVKSYVTMDTLQYFMAAHLLNLKANPNEDGEVDLKADLFDKANIIYTPCDKNPAPVCPPKGQLIKTYCDGTEKMGRWTDGACGFYDELMESNSDDCDYVEHPKQGTQINTFCKDYALYAKVADGRGGTTDSLLDEFSEKCGWDPVPMGTVLSSRCEGFDTITKYADGKNGNYELVTKVNDPNCGYVEYPEEGKVLSEYCIGFDRVTRYADGKGSSYEAITKVNDPDCGY